MWQHFQQVKKKLITISYIISFHISRSPLEITSEEIQVFVKNKMKIKVKKKTTVPSLMNIIT